LDSQGRELLSKIVALDRVLELLRVQTDFAPAREELAKRVSEERHQEVSATREFILSELSRVRDIHDERFRVSQAELDNVRTVHDEKFSAVDTRFQERDERTAQAAQESRISLDAALAAAKEAVGEQNKANSTAIAKSELATQKQIDSMETLMQTNFSAMESRLADLKSRIDRGEGSDSRFITRDSFDLTHKALTDRVGELSNQLSNLQGRGAAFAVILTMVAAAATILSHFIR
jgi:hypothetical protein